LEYTAFVFVSAFSLEIFAYAKLQITSSGDKVNSFHNLLIDA
jgi:hypothetical protein